VYSGYIPTGSAEWLKRERDDLVHDIEWHLEQLEFYKSMKKSHELDPAGDKTQLLAGFQELIESEIEFVAHYRGQLRLLRDNPNEYTRRWKNWAQKELPRLSD
jgi:hypothetical protein